MTNGVQAQHPSGLTLVYAPSWTSAVKDLIVQFSNRVSSPMSLDLIVVPGTGHARDLSQKFATRFGVFAGIDTPSWAGFERLLESDAQLGKLWDGSGLPALVLEVIDQLVETSPDGYLSRYLQKPATHPGRRGSFASRAARLFRKYLDNCPQMLESWSSPDCFLGPDGEDLPEEQHWQPELWRALIAKSQRLGTAGVDPLTKRQQSVSKLADGIGLENIPDQVFMVSMDQPTDYQLALVEALAKHRQIRCYQIRPFESSSSHQLVNHLGGRYRAAEQSWQSLLEKHPWETLQLAEARKSDTLLHTVQQEIREGVDANQSSKSLTGMASTKAAERLQLWHSDKSIQIHAAHGQDRQVEVLREQLCHLFVADPTLEPRDVVIAVTDLDSYAPLIRANFISSDPAIIKTHPGYQLRAEIGSQSTQLVNPVTKVLVQLLGLGSGRATAEDLLNFCSLAPVAHKFRFTEDDLASLADLLMEANIKWGIDLESRIDAILPLSVGTWFSGLQRLLVGFAIGDSPLMTLNEVAPARVDSTDADLVGKLAEIISRIRRYYYLSSEDRTIADWVSLWLELLDQLCDLPSEDYWQISAFTSTLQQLRDSTVQLTSLIHHEDAVRYLRSTLKPFRRRPNFGNGSMLFCSLGDLAGVEHRVVAILGLTDHSFPGRPRPIGNDLVSSKVNVKDSRSANLKYLLDAILAAQDKLLVVTQGADPITNVLRPAPVVIQELISAANLEGDPGWPTLTSAPAQSQRPSIFSGDLRLQNPRNLVTLHPLQPFDPANFYLGSKTPSFDQTALAGARALLKETAVDLDPPASPTPPSPLPPGTTDSDSTTLDDLISFFSNPAKALFKNTHGFTLFESEPVDPNIPVELDALDRWKLSERMVEGIINGNEVDAVVEVEKASGNLPPDPIGQRYVDSVFNNVMSVAKEVNYWMFKDQRGLASFLTYKTGTLSGVLRIFDNSLMSYTTGSLTAKRLIPIWLRLLFASASGIKDIKAALITRKGTYFLVPPEEHLAHLWLSQMISLRREGMSTPIPLPPKTAAVSVGVIEPFQRWKDSGESLRAEWARECSHEWAHYFDSSWSSLTEQETQPSDPHLNAFQVRDAPKQFPVLPRFQHLALWFWSPIEKALEDGEQYANR